jgi:hypothetical protein
MSVWNSALWLPNSIRGIYPYFDFILITESCWVKGDWAGDTSPDGTAAIIEKFMREEDPDDKIRFHKAGMVNSQPEGRNSGLYLIPRCVDYVYMVDSDEAYFEKDLEMLRFFLDRVDPKRYDTLKVPAKNFYFDGTYYRNEEFTRGYLWFPEQRFYAVGSMIGRSGNPAFDLSKLKIEMMHYSYVSKEWTKLKACIGEDVSRERYETWWNTVYSKFNGDLEKLYASNEGGPHVFGGGGPLLRYEGPHPSYMATLPVLSKAWERE